MKTLFALLFILSISCANAQITPIVKPANQLNKIATDSTPQKKQEIVTAQKPKPLSIPVIVREPSLYIYDDYIDNGGKPIRMLGDFTGKDNVIIERLGGVQGFAADRKGNVYEAIWTGSQAYIKEARKFGMYTGSLKQPMGIACDKQGRIYIADASLGQVIRIDDLSGTNEVTFGSKGTGVGQFKSPCGVAVDGLGRIYIADPGNQQIVRIDNMNGDGWKTFDGKGGENLGFVAQVRYIAVDSKNRLYYLKPDAGRLVRVDDINGGNMKFFAGTIDPVYHSKLLANPNGVAIDQNDRIYITDIDAKYITRIDDISGANRTLLNNNLFKRPSCIAVFYPVAEKPIR